MDQQQFYPTPPALAARMISKFIASPLDRDAQILEPSAGHGALVRSLVQAGEAAHRSVVREVGGAYWRRDAIHVDFIEIDMSKHTTLENIEGVKGEVIGLDFLEFKGSLAAYTHILMNPPFAAGVHHVLKAWEGLYDGEIVALVNAETLRNPFSKERQQLLKLIERHGDVEIVQDAFKGEDVQREAGVEVAIVHLIKKADLQDILSDVLDGLKEDATVDGGAAAYAASVNGHELAIPGDVIQMTATAFRVAVDAMRASVVAQARASYAARLVGQTMAQRNADAPVDKTLDLVKSIREGIAKGYAELKDRAWSEVLRSTKVSSKLSSKAQQQLEADFQRIKRLDFSTSNVYAFLLGLIESQGDMHLQMAFDCFDSITSDEDNVVWYAGYAGPYKSNLKHRTAGRRIKMTRFILTRFNGGWSKELGYSELQRLGDFDKVFEVLDGKAVGSSYGLRQMFQQNSRELACGQRVGSDYFEARWYPGRGTIHFFPKRKDLIDRLNRVVGRARQWLPEQDDMVSKDFWLAYERAEKFDEKVRKQVGPSRWHCDDPFWLATKDAHDESDQLRKQQAVDRIVDACLGVAKDAGLDPMKGIAGPSKTDLPLLAAA